MVRSGLLLLAVLCAAAQAAAQESEPRDESRKPWLLSVYLSTWINRCDVPAAAQLSSYTPALGPTFAVSNGRWRLSLSAYAGDYDFSPSGFDVIEGQTNVALDSLVPGNTLIEFSNESARKRGFTVQGQTQRQDVSFGVGYRFSNALQLGLSVEYNHRDAEYEVLLPLAAEPASLSPEILDLYAPEPVAGDPRGRVVLWGRGGYSIHQLWFGPQFHGFTPLSARFGGFYNASFLVLAHENRRAPVYHDELGLFRPPGHNGDLQLKARDFGDNFGTAFSLGLSYNLTPRMALWGGYSLKFFSEANTELLDHSLYQGPYFGVGYSFF
jgi:opacity protein-like surface antigen